MSLFWIAALAVLAYFLLKDRKHKADAGGDAEEALKRRYINGEIDEETYYRMKRTINL
ncbi:MAG: SHOCT domain-containing protein [Christensenellales bacterium]